MNLLDHLTSVSHEPVVTPEKPKRRSWRKPKRVTKATRQAASEKLAAELRARRQAWADELARDQSKMAALTWPDGIKVVG